MTNRGLILVGLLAISILPSLLVGAVAASTTEVSLVDVKNQKRFGIGLSAGGPLSVLGTEVDVNLSEYASISAGIGTGLDYSTMMIKTRFYLPGKWVSPYLGGGFARWWTAGTRQTKLGPSVLVNRFLPSDYNYADGFNVWMFYPTAGVQFMHPLGIAFFAEVEYLFRLISFSNGTYAGIGMHWYF